MTGEALRCPYCGAPARLVDSAVIYGWQSFGQSWVCDRYPACDSYVGCHYGTDRPLGRLADRELRQAKMAAHKAFDPIWRQGLMTRTAAYRWLSEQLGLPAEETHIGLFDVEACEKVIQVSAASRAAKGVAK